MSMDFCENRYLRIPDASKLQLHTLSQDTDLFVMGTLHDETGEQIAKWEHDKLFNKTVSRTLKAGKRYQARINVAFLGTATATIDVAMSVVKPNGLIRGPLYCTFAGKKGDLARSKLLIFMQRQ